MSQPGICPAICPAICHSRAIHTCTAMNGEYNAAGDPVSIYSKSLMVPVTDLITVSARIHDVSSTLWHIAGHIAGQIPGDIYPAATYRLVKPLNYVKFAI